MCFTTRASDEPWLSIPLAENCTIEGLATGSGPSKIMVPGLDKDKTGAQSKSTVREWLDHAPDTSLAGDIISPGWRAIGKDVYARKTLVLSASKDLLESGLTNDRATALSLASTDIFVEKAQGPLTKRGTKFYWAGISAATLTLGALVAFYALTRQDIANLRDELAAVALSPVAGVLPPQPASWAVDATNAASMPSFLNSNPPLFGLVGGVVGAASQTSALTNATGSTPRVPAVSLRPTATASGPGLTSIYLTLYILKATAGAACVFGAIYFLATLSRAFFHEATILFNRRHSLRFGRLCVYLAVKEKMSLKDLKDLFAWNAESSTAFKDIQADLVAKSPTSKVVELAIEAVRGAKGGKKGRE